MSTAQEVRRLLLILALPLSAGGCVESGWMVCADGRVCDEGRVCDVQNGVCSNPEEECFGKQDLSGCAGGGRICLGGRCASSCGDGARNGTDECDALDLGEATCADLGWYAGEVTCTAECAIDPSGCSGQCLDGRLDGPHEVCDPTDLGVPQGVSCVSLGFDAGRQGCASDCAALTDRPCMTFGWTVEDPIAAAGADSLLDMWGTGEDLLVLVRPGGVRSAAQGWAEVGVGGDDIRGRALWASSSADVWVIDEEGQGFFHSNGNVWTWTASPLAGLNEIWGSSASDIFAVGGRGAVVHFDGARWTAQPTRTRDSLRAIWGVSPTEVYAAGAGGSLLRYDGRRWSAIDSGTRETLTGVWADSRSAIWTVGTTTVRRFDGRGWTAMLAFEAGPDDRGWIAGTGPSDVWLSAGTGGTVRRHDGARWSTLLDGDSTGPHPLWVDPVAVAVGFGFGDGQGTVRRWYGAGAGPRLAEFGRWNDVWAPDADTWIAVGESIAGDRGLALHSDGSRFDFDGSLHDVRGFSRDRAYAAGAQGTVFAWDGAAWSVARPGDGETGATLWSSGSSDLYVLLNGYARASRILHFDGRRWTELPPLEPTCPGGVVNGWASSPQDILVVGFKLLARFDGSAWSCHRGDESTQFLSSVWGSAPDDAWILETSLEGYAALHHWDGAGLRRMDEVSWISRIDGSGVLMGTARDDVFLGTVAHFDGRVWSPLRTSAMQGTPLFALPSRLFMAGSTIRGPGLGQLVRTRFWNQRARELDCSDGVDDDADGATDRDDLDCGRSPRGGPWR